MGRRLTLSALVTVALAWPASAFAASGELNQGTMVYNAGGGESNNVTLTLVDDGFGNLFYQVVDAPAVSIAPTPPCENGFSGETNIMRCPTNGGGQPPPVRFAASLGDGNDSITLVANIPASIGAGGGQDVMNGGPADDFLRGGQGGDQINGGTGNDQLIGDDVVDPANPATAEGGNDTLTGGDGNDSIDGQAGNDRLVADNGADDLIGGDGVDVADYGARTDPQFLSLDGLRNDGQDTRTDNIHDDVENLAGGSGGDTLVGSAQANSLDGGPGSDSESGGDGADNLDGGAGDDLLDGGAGPDVLNGGDGADMGDYSSRTAAVAVTLDGSPGDGELGEGDNVEPDVENLRGGAGADTFIGSAAPNTLDGGAGEDYSDGGPGSDTLAGGGAGDVLRTRGSADGDTVTCGPGPDFVIAKRADTISADCDRADRGVNQKPIRRDSAVVTPLTGSLQMSPTGIVRRVPLQDKLVLPLRSVVDTIAGRVKVTSAPAVRKTRTVTLEDGAFDITQTAAKLAITQFALQGGDFGVCPTAAGRKASAAAGAKPSAKTVRKLWASGKGEFRTKGRYAAATVRGTRWETVDRCDGTLIRVKRGSVAVRDLVRKKTVVVTAGRPYLAKR